MEISRDRLAPRAFWLTAGQVVDASIDGLRRRKLFVIPGWRYRLLAAVFSKLPSSVRVPIEAARGNARVVDAARKPEVTA